LGLSDVYGFRIWAQTTRNMISFFGTTCIRTPGLPQAVPSYSNQAFHTHLASVPGYASASASSASSSRQASTRSQPPHTAGHHSEPALHSASNLSAPVHPDPLRRERGRFKSSDQ
ncbi:hypothetical protein ABVT39_020990, partial [Epinephelus coioides]